MLSTLNMTSSVDSDNDSFVLVDSSDFQGSSDDVNVVGCIADTTSGVLAAGLGSRKKSWSDIAAAKPAIVSTPPSRSTSPPQPKSTWTPLFKVVPTTARMPDTTLPSNLQVEEDEDGCSDRLAVKATGGIARVNSLKVRMWMCGVHTSCKC